MTPSQLIAAQAEHILALTRENTRMRAALEQIAHTTMQAPLNRLAHQALGHEPNPYTVELLADIESDRRIA
ncbi:hypothetical protein [Streptosporangium sp. CA-115845]|uniref:hypothetical protein n=1 Tax=Streptosporangium sp. CA-115845 TaxID=3240071 RepID=UPI003D8E1FE9